MNNYEAKIEAKRERYEDLAAKKAGESDALFDRARKMASVIPFGQPILVGHHSEKRDRNYRGKIHRTMDRACETSKVADHYAQKAASVGTGGISSDDPEATRKIRRQLEELEASQALMVAGNKIYKGKLTDDEKVEALCALGLTERNARGRLKPDFCGRIGFPSYELTNNGANIRRLKARVEHLEREATARPEETTESDAGPYTLIEDVEDNRLLLQFHQRAPQAVCDLLKRNGFRWAPSKGSWSRQLNANSRATEKYLRLEIILTCEPVSKDALHAEITKARSSYDRAGMMMQEHAEGSNSQFNLRYAMKTAQGDLRKCLTALAAAYTAEDASRDWSYLLQDHRLESTF